METNAVTVHDGSKVSARLSSKLARVGGMIVYNFSEIDAVSFEYTDKSSSSRYLKLKVRITSSIKERDGKAFNLTFSQDLAHVDISMLYRMFRIEYTRCYNIARRSIA